MRKIGSITKIRPLPSWLQEEFFESNISKFDEYIGLSFLYLFQSIQRPPPTPAPRKRGPMTFCCYSQLIKPAGYFNFHLNNCHAVMTLIYGFSIAVKLLTFKLIVCCKVICYEIFLIIGCSSDNTNCMNCIWFNNQKNIDSCLYLLILLHVCSSGLLSNDKMHCIKSRTCLHNPIQFFPPLTDEPICLLLL